MSDEYGKIIIGTPVILEKELRKRQARMLEAKEVKSLLNFLNSNPKDPLCRELYENMMQKRVFFEEGRPAGELVKVRVSGLEKYFPIIGPNHWAKCQNPPSEEFLMPEGVLGTDSPMGLEMNYMGAREVKSILNQ